MFLHLHVNRNPQSLGKQGVPLRISILGIFHNEKHYFDQKKNPLFEKNKHSCLLNTIHSLCKLYEQIFKVMLNTKKDHQHYYICSIIFFAALTNDQNFAT